MIRLEIPGDSIDNVDQSVNKTSTSSFVGCFFKNRYSDGEVMSLAERCLPADGNADWAEIHSCATEPEDTVTSLFEKVTTPVADDLKADGLVVRIKGTADPNAKTNLLDAVCKAIPVNCFLISLDKI